MNHKEKELLLIKNEVAEMWNLVISQLEKSKTAVLNNDIELAREIANKEKRVDVFELKIECDCENYIALYNPVAIDLRLILSLIKITNTLERIADFCKGMAHYVIEGNNVGQNARLLEQLELEKMFDLLISMLYDSYVAIESENTKISGKILSKDDDVDLIYKNSISILAEYLKENTELIPVGLKILLMIRRLERIGDHCINIVEDIVFYIDAKVLKHVKKKR